MFVNLKMYSEAAFSAPKPHVIAAAAAAAQTGDIVLLVGNLNKTKMIH